MLANFLGSYGIAILTLSAITSLLMVPLLRFAGKAAERERQLQEQMTPLLTKIKLQSHGHEQHFRIKALYERFSYNPFLAVRRVFPLLIQLPFLILTYQMIMRVLPQLNEKTFSFIDNLATPDQLLYGVNILPFAMTFVNLCAAVTIPGFSRKDFFQAAGISLLFLVFLYRAPSALLVYWTCNNLITLGNNSFNLIKQGKLNIRYLRELLHKGNLLNMGKKTAYLFDKYCPEIIIFLLVLSIYNCFVKYFHAIGAINSFTNKTANVLFILLNYLFCIASAYYLLKSKTFYKQLWSRCIIKYYMLVFSFINIFLWIWILIYFSINNHSSRIWLPLLLIEAYQITTILFLIFWLQKCSRINNRKLFIQDYFILLWIAAVAIHYITANHSIYPGLRCYFIFPLMLLLPVACVYYLLNIVFKNLVKYDFLMPLIFAAFLVFYTVPMFASGTGIPFLEPENNILFQYILLLAISFLFIYLFNYKKDFFIKVTVFLFIIVFANAIYTCFIKHNDSGLDNPQAGFLANVGLKKRQDIILLIYDGYPAPDFLKAMGVDNSKQLKFLKDNGFTIYKNIYSLACWTVFSMSSMVDIKTYPSSVDQQKPLAGYNQVNSLLKKHGYTCFYVVTGYAAAASALYQNNPDFVFPKTSTCTEIYLWRCIMEGIFSREAAFFNDYSEQDKAEIVEKLLTQKKEPSFTYIHLQYPGHFPFSSNKYKNVLPYFMNANNMMRKHIDLIKNRKDSIIIIAGDHGTWATWDNKSRIDSPGQLTAVQLLDKYGMFLAIRWPEDYKQKMKIKILQDVLLEVIMYLADDDSLKIFRLDRSTFGRNLSMIPDGAIKDGIIQIGRDKGKNLFEAGLKVPENKKYKLTLP